MRSLSGLIHSGPQRYVTADLGDDRPAVWIFHGDSTRHTLAFRRPATVRSHGYSRLHRPDWPSTSLVTVGVMVCSGTRVDRQKGYGSDQRIARPEEHNGRVFGQLMSTLGELGFFLEARGQTRPARRPLQPNP
jgi:hypothetical protein